jgi:hypothetical protein
MCINSYLRGVIYSLVFLMSVNASAAPAPFRPRASAPPSLTFSCILPNGASATLVVSGDGTQASFGGTGAGPTYVDANGNNATDLFEINGLFSGTLGFWCAKGPISYTYGVGNTYIYWSPGGNVEIVGDETYGYTLIFYDADGSVFMACQSE